MITVTYKNIGLAALLAISMVSCKKEFLERPPEDQIVDANYYKTSEQILAGTSGLYNIVWFAYNDKASHGIGDARGGVLASGSYQLENISMNTTAVTGENASSWRSFFNVVGQANAAANNIAKYAGDAVPTNIKNQGIAEARFMRGLAYSYLVQNWGPVPIITDNVALLQDTSIARNTEESVWEFIIRDLRFAANNLPTTNVKGRLTKYAAQGMLSRMFLTRAGVGQSGTRKQADLDSAKFYAKEVIDKSGGTLMSSYEDLFMLKNNNNAESLFALQWTYNGDWGSQNSSQAYLAFGSSITGFADGWGGDLGGSVDQMKLYDPNYVEGSNVINISATGDKRRKATFMFPGDHYSYIHQQVDDPNNPGKTLIQELDVPLNTTGGLKYNTRAWVKKYVVGRPQDNDGKVGQQRTENSTYMMRLAEVYLIYAEAILGNNQSTTDAEALKYFNAIRTRAGVPSKSSITWDDIYKERRLEFGMEGMAWYDMVRLYYFNPSKAFAMLNAQARRPNYRIVPNAEKNPTSWMITSTGESTYQVGESNFRLPIPAGESTKAPNLSKPAVPYSFDK